MTAAAHGRRGAAGARGAAATALAALALAACGSGAGPAAPAPGGTAPEGPTAAAGNAPATPATGLRFVDGTADAGLDVRHFAGHTAERYAPEIMGPGVAVVDVNRDGAPDLYVVDSGDVTGGPRPPAARDKLLLNDGAGRFTDATETWGVPSRGYGMGVAVGDVDGDGWPDLYLTTFGPGSRLLRNTGAGFEDVTERSGIADDGRWSTSAGFLDLEKDGDLDLWVTRYTDYRIDTALRCYSNDTHVYCTPEMYEGVPDRLLRNEGDGTFTDLSAASGVGALGLRSLALVVGDLEGDGDVDVYEANDLDRNALWLNDGAGGLTEIGRLAGVAFGATGLEEAGMGADMGDFDLDGRLDLVVPNFQGETTSLYRQGDGLLFTEVSDRVGVGASARARLGFGVDFFDADNDGDEDLLVANGHLYDNVASFMGDVSFGQPNTLYENRGDGTFTDVTTGAGPALADAQASRGLATGDLDGDGDLDYVVTNNGGTLQLGRNETAGAGHFVGLWLEGGPANRTAIGARVEARVGDRRLTRQVVGAASYLSFPDARVHIGLGPAERVDALTIHWPGGEAQSVDGLEADRWYHVRQGRPPAPFVPGAAVIAP